MIHFGTGGWRDVIGEGFTRENIEKLAEAMVMKVTAEGVREKGIVIGFDRRFLSAEAAVWLADVFAKRGIRVRLVKDPVPTPTVMYYVKEHDLPYGLMVTASHNPAIFNGVKLFIAGGRDADKEVTDDVEAYLRKAEKEYIPDTSENGFMPPDSYRRFVASGMITETDCLDEYIDGILRDIDIDAIRQKKPYVAVDPMYGVSLRAPNIILTIGRCKLETINTEHDTLFGGRMPSPNHETIRKLQYFVGEKGCEIGVATDGDGDRLGVVDDEGTYLHANDILVMVYYYMVKYKGLRGPVVRNCATTHRLDGLAALFHEACYEVPVGFKNISAKMKETNALIGGESSGGIAVQGRTNGKDGVFSAALLVEMIAVTGKKLSEFAREVALLVPQTGFEECNARFKAERKQEIVDMVGDDAFIRELPFDITRIDRSDGCKLHFADGGWVIIRFSGTEPVLRIFCEESTQEKAKEVCREVTRHLDL